MKERFTIKIKIYSDQSTILSFLLLGFVMFIGFFTFNFGLPESVLYFCDFLVVLLLLLNIKRLRLVLRERQIRVVMKLILLVLLEGIFSSVVHGGSLFLIIWSVRNWGRFFAFLLICVVVMDRKRIDDLISFTFGVFHVNFFVILFQYYLLHLTSYSQDALNGFFGRKTSGVNITMCSVVFILTCAQYYSKKCTWKKLVLVMAEVSIISVLAELRAVLVFELVFLLVFTILNLRLSFVQMAKYFLICVAAFFALYMFSQWLITLYPQFEEYFSLEGVIAAAYTSDGYGHSGYIDRLNAIPTINTYFFDSIGLGAKLFGIGMGNAEYSAVSLFCSPFYNLYGETFGYLNFTSAMIYLEIGFVGLFLYTAIFLYLFWIFMRKVQKNLALKQYGGAYYNNIGMGMAVLSVIFIVYNNVHRTDVSILLAFYQAIPIAISYHAQEGEVI